MEEYIVGFENLGMNDVERVGGKNASLGEMISGLSSAGVTVPGGFATTAHAYRRFLAQDNLADRINAELAKLDVDDVIALAETGSRIRQWVLDTPFPAEFEQALENAFAKLQDGNENLAVAVRSSATAEDLPDASFA
ncbi:MAG: phosphoenolpyruvate synthase, partial [Gammaproteobacteria bacterium]